LPPIKKRQIQSRQVDPLKAEPKADRPIQPLALSIREFAEAHNLSIDTYFKMQRDGFGPKVMRVGGRTLVSLEAAAEWRAEREKATDQRKPAAEAGLLRAPGSFSQS
jgi:hypothetical protein